MSMTSRERVLTALQRGVPDRVPYCELGVDRALAKKVLGWKGEAKVGYDRETNQFTVAEAKELAAALHKDNIAFVLRAPVYAQKVAGQDGRLFYGEGMIKTEADVDMIQLPNPEDDALYVEAAEFAANKEDFAAWFVTRAGIFPTMLSMGLETFSIALYENRPFLERVLDIYTDWAVAVTRRACQLGFDVYASTDDMAFKSAPFFSPKVFHELVLPRYWRVAAEVTLPWVIHSDGNIMPFMDDLVSLGIAGVHPNEKGAMEPRVTKAKYGDKVCVLGNVDLNLLGMATPEDVDREVRALIHDLAPGGGYIVTSGNSLASYCDPANVRAMAEAVRKYGRYPLQV